MIWSKLIKNMHTLLHPELRNRITFTSAVYRKLGHDNYGRCTVCLDGSEIFVADTLLSIKKRNELQLESGIYEQIDFVRSLHQYLQMTIDDALNSSDPLIKGIAVIDRRTGKRRLQSMDVSTEHPFVQIMWYARKDL